MGTAVNIECKKRKEPDGTYTVTITFTDVPDEQQAEAAATLVKRALLERGAVGVIGAPFKFSGSNND